MTESPMLEIAPAVCLQAMNSLGIAVRAEYFCRPSSVDQIYQALDFAHTKGLAVTALGGGSNLVLAGDILGLVIVVDIKGVSCQEAEGQRLAVRFGAGEDWHEMVQHCLNKGWYGLENLSLIPGSMGAAPIQNIGAYGVELSDLFVSLETIEIATGKPRRFDRQDCQFGYRDSIFKQSLKSQHLITAVTLNLTRQAQVNIDYPALRDSLPETAPTPLQVSAAVCKIRRQKLPDPAVIPNVGSFFTNPVVSSEQARQLRSEHPNMPWYAQSDGRFKIPAAWLIDQCGFRAKRYGNVAVHKHQALVLVNHGGTGIEILALAERIKQAVQAAFAIELVIEPSIYGLT